MLRQIAYATCLFFERDVVIELIVYLSVKQKRKILFA